MGPQFLVGQTCPLFDSCPMGPEHAESDFVERHTPRPVRLRRLLSESPRDEHDRPSYLNLTLVEIEVGPAERAKLTPAHPGQRRHHHQRCEARIALFSGNHELSHGVNRRWPDDPLRDTWRFGHLSHVPPDPSPPYGL